MTLEILSSSIAFPVAFERDEEWRGNVALPPEISDGHNIPLSTLYDRISVGSIQSPPPISEDSGGGACDKIHRKPQTGIESQLHNNSSCALDVGICHLCYLSSGLWCSKYFISSRYRARRVTILVTVAKNEGTRSRQPSALLIPAFDCKLDVFK